MSRGGLFVFRCWEHVAIRLDRSSFWRWLNLKGVNCQMKLVRSVSFSMTCAGYLGHPFVKKGYKIRKQPNALKMNWLPVSAVTPGVLQIIRRPSVSSIYSAIDYC